MKKYVIHILAVPAVSGKVFDIPYSNCAIILCTSRSNAFIDSIRCEKLVLDFLDVEDRRHDRAFDRACASTIISFINKLPANISDLYVCCSKGGSRSAGCAAALMLMSGRSDRDVWRNPFYTPNTLVFRLLCQEYGIFMPMIFVRWRKWINERSFKKAQKRNGDTGEYERWQILF